ncbi:MAG TPA: hypothetical protein PLP07_05900 [Pyrinomonadaceae bacterium]|nr:hypothetical protein [Pyrinomonadaceae bacterium]HQY67146.1 hypothetical protein [Pyrinomonadaceae bacterium]HRA39174.1 hypothetical protein [Pyrinomonadaceae bacterium]
MAKHDRSERSHPAITVFAARSKVVVDLHFTDDLRNNTRPL